MKKLMRMSVFYLSSFSCLTAMKEPHSSFLRDTYLYTVALFRHALCKPVRRSFPP